MTYFIAFASKPELFEIEDLLRYFNAPIQLKAIDKNHRFHNRLTINGNLREIYKCASNTLLLKSLRNTTINLKDYVTCPSQKRFLNDMSLNYGMAIYDRKSCALHVKKTETIGHNYFFMILGWALAIFFAKILVYLKNSLTCTLNVVASQ